MAEEKKEEDKKEAGKDEKAGGGNKMMIIIIAVVFLLLIIIIGVLFFVMSSSKEQDIATTATETQAPNNAPANTQANKRVADLVNIGTIYPLDQFIINLVAQSGRRYLRTTIHLDVDSAKAVPELDMKKAAIRDVVINILSSKTLEEVTTIRGKDQIKEEIVNRLNEFLVDGRVNNLFFVDFVVQ